MPQLEAPHRPHGESRRLLDDIHFYVGVARRGWKLIALAILVSLTLASIHLARSITLYRATARLLLIQQAGQSLNGGADRFHSTQNSGEELATHLLLMRSPVIVEQAIQHGGLHDISTAGVIAGLSVKQPDPMAKIVEITFRSASQDQAAKVVDGVMRSYNDFLKQNFQKNTNDIITLIVKARDDLSKELTSLEQQYLDYRQKNPAYSADERGRSFIARRLDQWDQSMNQVLGRSLQLKSQLELGRKLAGEGLDPESVTTALNQLSGLGGGSPIAAPTAAVAAVENRGVSGPTVERLRDEVADIENRRLGAELHLTHLRRELAASAAASPPSDREIADAFNADPDVARLREERKLKQTRLQSAQRVSRAASDPTIVGIRRRIQEIDDEIQELWTQERPHLLARHSVGTNPEILDAVHKAEAELIGMKARQAALKEQLEQVAAKELQRLWRERDQIRKTTPGGNPARLQQIEQQIARIERGADQPADRPASGPPGEALLGSIARSLEAVEAMRNDIQKKFDEDLEASKKSEIGQLGEANLRSNLDRHRTLFNSVVDQLKQVQLASDFGSVSAQTINPTEVAAERPKYLSIMTLALMAGCAAGGLGAYLIELLDSRVRTLAEMRELLALPVLGMVPELSTEQVGSTGKIGLLSHDIPRSALAESYKSTRTNLEFLRRNRRAQVLLVSSPQPSDGKSTTASNLAITLAHAGRKVLLIDGDLRKPSQHLIYGLPEGRGLSDAIEGGGTIPQFAQPTLVENLELLRTGSDVPHPAELLSSPRLAEILDGVREQYDIVIIDSSPLLAVTDPSIIAAVADGILLVVRVARTRRHDVERTKDLLATMGLPVLGVVINGVTGNQLGYGYGYGGYGYGNRGGTAKSTPNTAPFDPATEPVAGLNPPGAAIELEPPDFAGDDLAPMADFARRPMVPSGGRVNPYSNGTPTMATPPE